MTVRPATERDVPRIIEMGRAFLQASPYVAVLRENPAQIETFTRWLLTNPEGLLLVLEDRGGAVAGMFGALLAPHYFSGDMMATEVVWWVEPDARGAGKLLLAAAEQHAQAHGAIALQMIAPDPRVGTLYERAGYRFVESAYQKTW